MADDERALRERMAELEAEVRAARPARPKVEPTLIAPKPRAISPVVEDEDPSDLSNALALATKATRVKRELAKKPEQGQKSWIRSGLASTFLGPIGWLYAGSMREAIPGTAAWLVILSIAMKLPFLLMPLVMFAMPLSGIAGVVYALQYNRHGKRQRLFDRDDKPAPKQLGS